ncbi:hypothetical protein D3C80_648400 [compost metagenome]
MPRIGTPSTSILSSSVTLTTGVSSGLPFNVTRPSRIIRSTSRREATPTRARIFEIRSGLPSVGVDAPSPTNSSRLAERTGFLTAPSALARGFAAPAGLSLNLAPGLPEDLKPCLPPDLEAVLPSAFGLISRTKVFASPRFGLSFEFICCLPEAGCRRSIPDILVRVDQMDAHLSRARFALHASYQFMRSGLRGNR